MVTERKSMAPTAISVPVAPMTGTPYYRYALGLLLVINVLNFVDRQIISILAEPIKRELGLADWQLGIMTGLAFALFYTGLGIPIARLAERANRAAIISASIALWSGFTMLCSVAQNFGQLIAARAGVGIGEAGCTPAAHSLISDYTSKENRASALAVYAMGTPIGSVIGLMLGGLIIDAWGWRTAFLVCGAPGIIAGAIALLSLREPRLQLARDLARRAPSGVTMRDAIVELRGNRTFWRLALAAAMTGIVGYGGGAFLPSFFFRNHGEELATLGSSFGMQAAGFLGIILGVAAGVAGVLGTFLGGWLADRRGPSDSRAYALIPAIAGLMCFPFYVAAMLTHSALVAICLVAIANLFITIWSGPVFAAVQGLVKPHTRATAAAVLLLVINLIGLGLGPVLVGLLSDYFSARLGPSEGVRWAQVAVTMAGFASVAIFWSARKHIREEMVH